MSGITASRLELGTALADLRPVYDPGAISPPGVLIAAADPWITESGLTVVSRKLRWRVIAVAGRADAEVTLEDLEDLVAAVILAAEPLGSGWGTPQWDAPGTVDLGGAQYLAAVGRIEHATEV